ncbi:hypothetical protein HQ584_03470 [Patescibacteria group bacterium]|nr:hypothetical protein [Patescibacteria group bacterium]
MFKIGWFSTGKDEAACKLLEVVWESIKKKKIKNSTICFVFSNREEGEAKLSDEFLKAASKLNISLICSSSRKFKPAMRKKALNGEKKGNLKLIKKWRASYDEIIIRKIEPYSVDLILLAGYMLILGEKFCQRYKIINLHPSAPGGPKGTWQEVIWQLIEKKATQSGVMMHLVTPRLDAGPVLTYCSFPLRGGKFEPLWGKIEKKSLEQIKKEEGEKESLFKVIREEGVKRELPLIVNTLKFLAEGKIKLKEIKKSGPICLNL